MRKLGVGIAVLLGFGLTAEADVYRTHVQGSAAIASFSGVSADGCTETTGTLIALSSSDGTYAIASATNYNSCTGVSGFYAGAGSVTYSASGLSSASAAGTVVAEEYTGHGIAPITIEFALSFTGTGSVSSTSSRFTSGGGGATVSFVAQRTRAATVSGSLSIDGDAASVTDGQLAGETAGELSVVH
ncbi:MAG TPA: hypothetical protein VIV40_42385 [Kofleriaceae bacterium]